MNKLTKMNRGDKIYLDENNTDDSSIVNNYLACRDGIVEVYQYEIDWSVKRLFVCHDSKYESYAIVTQDYDEKNKRWREDCMTFQTEEFEYLSSLIAGKSLTGYKKEQYLEIRNFTKR